MSAWQLLPAIRDLYWKLAESYSIYTRDIGLFSSSEGICVYRHNTPGTIWCQYRYLGMFLYSYALPYPHVHMCVTS
jgi:hypothetical protein